MEERKQMTGRKEKGITLIALVVTIIVLIILATVSINMVVGENGLIKKAEQARDAYENSSKKEEEGLDSIVEEYDYLMELRKLPQGLNGKPLVDGLTEIQKRTVKAEDKYGKEVTVPKGFKVVPECGTTVSDGIVIEDEDGNQFVWVPCTEEQYKKHEYNTKKIDDTKSENHTDDGNGNWKTEHYRNYKDWQEEGGNALSVAKNGGFYIGRYEAGVPDNASFSINNESNRETMPYYTDSNSNENKSKNVTEEIINNVKTKLRPVSKQGMQAWTYISQTNAVEVSKNMYSGAESNYGVTSALIDGIAWDRTVEWLGESYTNIASESSTHGNYNNNTTLLTENVLYAQHMIAKLKPGQTGEATGWVYANKYKRGLAKLGEEELKENGEGILKYNSADYTNGSNYSTTTHTLLKRVELSTGVLSDFKLRNIYDMAGNIWEWTTETGYHDAINTVTDTKYVILRGGSFEYNSANAPISYRRGDFTNSFTFTSIGFRVVLYVK